MLKNSLKTDILKVSDDTQSRYDCTQLKALIGSAASLMVCMFGQQEKCFCLFFITVPQTFALWLYVPASHLQMLHGSPSRRPIITQCS